MTTSLSKRKNGNGHSFFPTDFFRNRFFTPSLFDFDDDFFTGGLKVPPANITENKNEFRLDLSVPGMSRKDFKVEVENGALVISCEKEEEKKDDKEGYYREEFSYNSFSRSFRLPENVKEEGINAKYENGILKVSIPKKEESTAKSKKAIEVG